MPEFVFFSLFLVWFVGVGIHIWLCAHPCLDDRCFPESPFCCGRDTDGKCYH